MNRRLALGNMLALAASSTGLVRADQRARLPIIALPLIFADREDPVTQSVLRGLRDFGWEDGKNIRVEHRYGEGKVERLPALVAELAALKPDVYIAAAMPIVRQIQAVAGTTPIVLVAYDYDPVAAGFVASMNRPGGNITGVYAQTFELSGKILELLKDLMPTLKRAAVFYDDLSKRFLEHFRVASDILGLKLEAIEIGPPFDYDAAFNQSRRLGCEAMALAFSPRFYGHRHKLARAAQRYRFPVTFNGSSWMQDGLLLSYGADASDMWGRAGYFIDRILKGDRPSELPVEQPNRYKLRVNLRTAKALGISVPEVIMVRADEVMK